ncbi:MAG: SDR family oxidoreductase [Deltaproteobacteria bacterium]|nr:SDR family oxidoreductase [Deltaproteobacteria bacterium]
MQRPLAVVTGASSGIGEALALRLGSAGYDLLLVARREALLTELSARIVREHPEVRADVFALDLCTDDAAQKLLDRAPTASVLVNNAGFGKVGEALSIENGVYEQMIALNVAALTQLTLTFARRMVERGGGTILNVGSTSGFQPIPFQAVYAATKAYVMSFSEALSYELRGKGVSVLGLYPGPTKTGFSEIAGAQEHAKKHARVFMSADAVAALAMDQIKTGKESVVAGKLNAVAATLSQLGPRKAARRVAAAIFKPR